MLSHDAISQVKSDHVIRALSSASLTIPSRVAMAQVLTEHIISTADPLRVMYPVAKLAVLGFPTHQQTTLDLIMTDLSHQYSPLKPLPPMGRSTHLSILWTPTPTTSRHRSAVTKTHRPYA
ncbi:hypothetical protein E2C01_068193 [Portunus trituberculatus]|uniref:Uncharacterized protein n=1 Tax=Portunus trituberculatus TaxID=210409 RepID=A0A5B7HV51_PORTR|nr:hypothetical protein [Portunus trituberculatus]